MDLAVLEKRGTVPSVLLVQCPSSSLDIFIEDKLKKLLGSNQNTVFSVKTRKDFKDMRMLCSVQPFQSTKWLYRIDLDKFPPDKDLYNLIKESSTICFLLSCSKYSVYKEVKEKTKGIDGVLDFYISYLSGRDFGYIYTKLVVDIGKDKHVTKDIYQYVKDGYSNDVDSIMLFIEFVRDFDEKDTLITKAMITEVCGIGGNTLDSFVFSLLKDAPKATERSFNTVLRKRFQAGVELSDSYDWGKFHAYLKKIVYNIMCVKELLIANAVYKTIRELPDGYDEKALRRYNRYVWRIDLIPMSRVLRLSAVLGESRWASSTDFMLFMYKFYGYQVLSETLLRDKEIKK